MNNLSLWIMSKTNKNYGLKIPFKYIVSTIVFVACIDIFWGAGHKSADWLKTICIIYWNFRMFWRSFENILRIVRICLIVENIILCYRLWLKTNDRRPKCFFYCIKKCASDFYWNFILQNPLKIRKTYSI